MGNSIEAEEDHVAQAKKCLESIYKDWQEQETLSGVREFPTGATRSANTDKLEYSRFFDARVMKRWAEYMHKHRKQADGSVRDPDNWKKGIPKEAYCESLHRHYQDIWLWSQGYESEMTEELPESICAMLFNLHGLLFEVLKNAE